MSTADKTLNVILLAAGQGLRMGGPNKLLLPFKGSTVLEATLEQICKAEIGPVMVVTGHQREAILPCLANYPIREVFNPEYASGMTSSIQTGVREADRAGYMICLSDMPWIAAATYQHLRNRFFEGLKTDYQTIVMPSFENTKGNPVVFSAAYREEILRHPEPEGCRGIVQSNSAQVLWVDMEDAGVLKDLDTWGDYLGVG